jgi:hypothetical protein
MLMLLLPASARRLVRCWNLHRANSRMLLCWGCRQLSISKSNDAKYQSTRYELLDTLWQHGGWSSSKRTAAARVCGYESDTRRRVRFVPGFAQGKKPKSASHDQRNEGSKDSSSRLRDLAERTQPFPRISNGKENYRVIGPGTAALEVRCGYGAVTGGRFGCGPFCEALRPSRSRHALNSCGSTAA